jgi:8-oxo-dGTP pyrophosphatase MutT (NUDIX family)
MPTSRLKIAALCLLNSAGELLVVRKRNTQLFMLPGGKLEPHESTLEALQRELKEELNLELETDKCLSLGRFTAPAANEPDTIIEAELFLAHDDQPTLAVAAELEAMAWLTLTPPYALPLAPLLIEQVLPLLDARMEFRSTSRVD